MLRIFTPVKIQRLRPGLNPRTWVHLDNKIYAYFSLILRFCTPFLNEILNYLPLWFLFMIQIFALSYISDVTDLTIWQAKQQFGWRNAAHWSWSHVTWTIFVFILWLPSNRTAGTDVSEESTTCNFSAYAFFVEGATLYFSEALQQITFHLHSGVFRTVKVSVNAQLRVKFVSTMTQGKNTR